jgi:CHAT domain-containing protein
MKTTRILLLLLLLTWTCLAEMTISQLTDLFHAGKYEALVTEGEILGQRLQKENDRQGVAQVYQMLTIAYMRLGRQEDMMRANAISKGAFAADGENSTDPAERERAICSQASALFSQGDVKKTVAFVDGHLKTWPASSLNRSTLINTKFYAIYFAQDLERALTALDGEIAILEQLLLLEPENRRYHLANIGQACLKGAEALMYVDAARSQVYGKRAKAAVAESHSLGLTDQVGGPNLSFRLAAAAGDYAESLRLFDEYDSTFNSNKAFYRFGVESRRAYWMEQLGRKRDAFAAYDQAIRVIDGAWSNLKLRQNKATLMSRDMKANNWLPAGLVFERAISLALELGENERALELSELFKSRTLRDALSRQELEKLRPQKMAADVLQRERDLYKKLAVKPEPSDVRSYLEVLAQIQSQDPEYFNLLTGDPGELRLPKLAEDELLVEYFVTEHELLIFTYDHAKTIMGIRQPVQRDVLDERVDDIRKAITRVTSAKTLNKKLSVMSADLIGPVEKALVGKKTVIFVPHGRLHYLPFSTLVTSDGEYLIKKYEVIEAPSAHSLSFSQSKNARRESAFEVLAKRSTVFALGNMASGDWTALPGTEVESLTVKGILPQTTTFVAQNLTRDSMLANIVQSEIVHIATHGFLDKTQPLDSGLVTSDQAVTVGDILQSRIPAYSVFLSACDTAVGKETQADELVGLQQSFLYAGAPSVIATLWQISDEGTTGLVTRYYEELKTNPKGAALRRAQLEMLDGKYAHPYYWAAFVLSGDWI